MKTFSQRIFSVFTYPLLFTLATLFVLTGCKPASSSQDKDILYYQSPMHPWITSDHPGQCTICGMDLVPIHNGESGITLDPGMLSLNNASIETVGIATASARIAPISREIRLAGRLEGDESHHRIIAAFFDGRVDKAFIEQVGETVKAGQPLAALYSPDLLYVVREYQVAASQGNASQVRNSRQRLIQFGLQSEQIDSLAKDPRNVYTIPLLSPIEGTVVIRNIYPGKYFKTGDPLLELTDFSTMWFHAEVYERDLASIRIGQKAQVTTPAVPGKVFEGTVTFIDPNFDAITRSTKVRIEVPNPVIPGSTNGRRELPHRAYAEALIRISEGDTLLVPRQAVLDDGRGAIVFVKRNASVFERRSVSIGRRGDDSAEILQGLKENEDVVVNGNLLLDAEAQLAFAGGESTPHPTDHADHSAHKDHAAHADQATQTTGTDHVASTTMSNYQSILAAADRLTRVLADENVSLFAKEAKQLSTLEAILTTPITDPEIKAAAESLRTTLDFPEISDLPSARRAFTPFSQAIAKFALVLKQQKQLPTDFGVFECPMTGTAYAGAPPSGRWVQTRGVVDNPYLGHSMRECGSEISK